MSTPTTPIDHDLTQNLCEDLLAVMMDMKHDLVELADDLNLTIAQLFALLTIKRHGSMPMRKMAGLLHCDASNVTGIVERLVARRLVIRTESPRDRREKMLELAGDGAQLIDTYLANLPEKFADRHLSEHELQVLAGIFGKLNNRRSL